MPSKTKKINKKFSNFFKTHKKKLLTATAVVTALGIKKKRNDRSKNTRKRGTDNGTTSPPTTHNNEQVTRKSQPSVANNRNPKTTSFNTKNGPDQYEGYTLEGYMTKKSSHHFKRWQKRFFELDGSSLKYYEDEEKKKKKIKIKY